MLAIGTYLLSSAVQTQGHLDTYPWADMKVYLVRKWETSKVPMIFLTESLRDILVKSLAYSTVVTEKLEKQ